MWNPFFSVSYNKDFNSLVQLSFRETLARFEELSDLFSNENNQIASRNLLMKVRMELLHIYLIVNCT